MVDGLGRPLRDLRVSLTDRCNLRCGYCMPAEVFDGGHRFLGEGELMGEGELAAIVGAFVRCGVVKLRITGGEPLLRVGVLDFLRGCGEGLEDVAMTTNGLLLGRHAGRLVEAGVHRVTVSLDALDGGIFGRMNGRGRGPGEVLEGIAAARAAGLGVKVNMVVQRGVNESEVLPMARYFKGEGVVLRFIEFMDVGNSNRWSREMVVGGGEILGMIGREMGFEEVERAHRGEVARRYRYLDDGVEFGVITSISAPFCGDCTRARLSADGRLFTCLFASEGFDLLGVWRRGGVGEDGLAEVVAGVWGGRADRYSELRAEEGDGGGRRVEMSFIGG